MLTLIALIFSLQTHSQPLQLDHPPHMDLEMTGAEYMQLRKRNGFRVVLSGLQSAIDLGERNLQWVTYMNTFRSESDRLSFSNKDNTRAYPVERPNTYNEAIVQKTYTELVSQLPQEMKTVLFGRDPFPKNPTLDTKAYLDWAFRIDRVYQSAVRWETLKPYIFQLSARKYMDIRGYYFLYREQDLANKLDNFSGLDAKTQDNYRSWLVNLCLNSKKSKAACESQLDSALKSSQVRAFYNQHQPYAQKIWDGFFAFYNPRKEAVWNSKQPNVMTIPFKNTGNEAVQSFLKFNLEQEFQWQGWEMKLFFKDTTFFEDIPHVVFVPGALPHVNGIGSSKITMDANAPLSEWDVQWTIRHEFGHVLGFVDCYIEFYDKDIEAIVGYQFDTTDLMCSRRGIMNARMFQQLKGGYYKEKALQ